MSRGRLVRPLRAWFHLREVLGRPHRHTLTEHEQASDTVLLAGSPWMTVDLPNTMASGTTTTFVVTNTTWPRRV